MSLNRVILLGTLTADPLSVGGGAARLARACFTLALDPPRSRRPSPGLPAQGASPPASAPPALPSSPMPSPRADFIPVLAYARTAEIALEFLKKGNRAIVEGRLREERWKPPHSSERSRLVVVAERVTSLEAARAGTSLPGRGDPPPPAPVGTGALERLPAIKTRGM